MHTEYFHPYVLRRAILEFIEISHWQSPLACTLTLKPDGISFETASLNLRHVLNKCNKKVFKSRFRNSKQAHSRLEVVPFLERHASGQPHYHLAIETPSTISKAALADLLLHEWTSSWYGGTQNLIETMWSPRWIDYMAKCRTKAEYADSIDWLNFHLASNSV